MGGIKMDLDNHGQLVAAAVHYRSNRDKLLQSLLGIVDGILANGIITPDEVRYLNYWLEDANSLINCWLLKDMHRKALDLVERQAFDHSELAHLKKCMLELLSNPRALEFDIDTVDADVEVLLGLCKGVTSDRVVDEREIKYLQYWLSGNPRVLSMWPASEIAPVIRGVLSDGVVTQKEAAEVLEMLALVVGKPIDDGVTDGNATLLPIDASAAFVPAGATVCVTGKFVHGPRDKVHKKLEAAGAIVATAVTKRLDYLVIGTLASRDWRHTTHGRKIEAVMNYRQHGAKTLIISESMLLQAI